MGAATAQLNVRIDPVLKKSGDSVLARHKLTPSDAVRALWDYLARNQTLPGFMEHQAAANDASIRGFESGRGLALDIALDRCGLDKRRDDPWLTMSQSEREDWIADQMIEEMQGSCR